MTRKVDVLVIGGGAAALNAAQVLGRARCSVVVVDGGKPRNAPAHGLHNFISRDGISPAELLRIGREECGAYGVEIITGEVVRLSGELGAFEATMSDGRIVSARRVLFATGMRETPPEIPGLAPLWGGAVASCPYCHGWEARDRHIVMLGSDESAFHRAEMLTSWSPSVTLATNGVEPGDAVHERMRAAGVVVETARIERVRSSGEELEAVVFVDGREIVCEAAFVASTLSADHSLAEQLDVTVSGLSIVTDGEGRTNVPGVYAAGSIVNPPAQVIWAAGDGNRVATILNFDHIQEVLAERRSAVAAT